ncbi:putative alternative RNA polymerase SigI [Mycobacterium antarcticum]|uniref:RNA polymerase sigma factor SigI n=1 Tax=unclassified Mycolicibacterium TaxID=2636767 RepID=UPI002382C21F|nr:MULTISPECIES: RNA polymerase sigma factor SigI [unclassified Mycolicibacterium]BDX33081.1 putative alternative RNA polymerase SigI [Mycolicibacterium sp. TUM20985]GLP76255.1 putative alternative RNA polymerase SigI [Mycolicibacterium sp. TUM20983]GLP83365.1 putative alternative RNA polymerase SigI [Mycolicibacterium sp. TUM20984]
MTITAAWRDHRPYLVNLAYQMVGDVGEAEDIAQEAFLRLSRTVLDDIDDLRGWLTVVAGRLCLDHLKSARVRLETKLAPEQESALVDVRIDTDPADRVTLDDEVGIALFEVLSQLSPGERVAFVLHDVFAVPFDEIAETVGRPAGTCRQLARRARAKFSANAPGHVEVAGAEHLRVTEAFISACAKGDISALTGLLDPDVWGSATVLAHPAPPPRVNRGPDDVAVNLVRYLGTGATVVSGPPGQPVLLAFARGRLFAVIVLTIHDGLVVKIVATADPSARRS